MENKKLKDAAHTYVGQKIFENGFRSFHGVEVESAFVAGAKWQAEQDTLTDANNISHRDETTSWVARDRKGDIYLYYTHKPVKHEDCGAWLAGGNNGRISRLPPDMLPQVKWEDEEPTIIDIEVSYKIK